MVAAKGGAGLQTLEYAVVSEVAPSHFATETIIHVTSCIAYLGQ